MASISTFSLSELPLSDGLSREQVRAVRQFNRDLRSVALSLQTLRLELARNVEQSSLKRLGADVTALAEALDQSRERVILLLGDAARNERNRQLISDERRRRALTDAMDSKAFRAMFTVDGELNRSTGQKAAQARLVPAVISVGEYAALLYTLIELEFIREQDDELQLTERGVKFLRRPTIFSVFGAGYNFARVHLTFVLGVLTAMFGAGSWFGTNIDNLLAVAPWATQLLGGA